MINNAKKRRSIFADKEEIFNHYQGRGAFTNWPEESLKAYINGGVRTENNQINLSVILNGRQKLLQFHMLQEQIL